MNWQETRTKLIEIDPRLTLPEEWTWEADLRGADLSEANLREADLRGTCIDPNLRDLQRRFCRECPPLKTGGRIVFRTLHSQHIASTKYEPGKTYIAPILSADIATACHPGIYAASLGWMLDNFSNEPLVRCYVRDGDWFITAKGAIRCKRIRVLGMYNGIDSAAGIED